MQVNLTQSLTARIKKDDFDIDSVITILRILDALSIRYRVLPQF